MIEPRVLPTSDRAGGSASGWWPLVSGVLSVLVLISMLQPPPATGSDALAFVTAHRGFVALAATIILSWAVFSIPFVSVLGSNVQSRNAALAGAATILSAGGILLLGFAVFMHIGAMLAIAEAGRPPDSADAAYQAAIWRNLSFFLTDPALMAWGLGQLLFAWLAWNDPLFPRWLAVIGLVGGIAGLLTLAVYQTGVLALVQLACFAVWGCAIGITLLRRARTP